MGVSNTAVMAHPSRKDMAIDLAAQLDAPVIWDEIGSRWETGRRAWLAIADSSEEWGMVVQDDAILCRGFTVKAAWAAIPPDSPLVLYAGNTAKWRPAFKAAGRASFLIMDTIWWGPGVMMPTHLIPDVVEHGDRLSKKSDQYDHLLGEYFAHHQIPVYYAWPSLIDHQRGPSLVGRRSPNRRAYRVSRNAAAERWRGPAVEVKPPRNTRPLIRR